MQEKWNFQGCYPSQDWVFRVFLSVIRYFANFPIGWSLVHRLDIFKVTKKFDNQLYYQRSERLHRCIHSSLSAFIGIKHKYNGFEFLLSQNITVKIFTSDYIPLESTDTSRVTNDPFTF